MRLTLLQTICNPCEAGQHEWMEDLQGDLQQIMMFVDYSEPKRLYSSHTLSDNLLYSLKKEKLEHKVNKV